MKISAIILTYNESIHLERCIKNISKIVDEIYVIDSFSTDDTKTIALSNSAIYLPHKFYNHSDQFNWGLSQLAEDTDWVIRIDADEYLTIDLINEISKKLPLIDQSINGILVPRLIKFQGKIIRHGGFSPSYILRIFRYGKGKCQNRWMDEHIIVNGDTCKFKSFLIDANKRHLDWWLKKHNKYASKEVIELLDIKYRFLNRANLNHNEQKRTKLQIRKFIYYKIPIQFRSSLFFLYRYILRLGFLDGFEGFAFHFLQGYWYRFIVDAKYREINNYIYKYKVNPIDAIYNLLDVDINLHDKE